MKKQKGRAEREECETFFTSNKYVRILYKILVSFPLITLPPPPAAEIAFLLRRFIFRRKNAARIPCLLPSLRLFVLACSIALQNKRQRAKTKTIVLSPGYWNNPGL